MVIEQAIQSILTTAEPLFESAFDPICIVNPTGKLVHFNRLMRELLNQPATDLRAQPSLESLLKFSEWNLQNSIAETLQSGRSFQFESSPAIIGEKKVLISIHGVPLYGDADQKQPIGLLLQLRNETPQAEFLQKYRLLLRSVLGVLDNGEEIKKMKETLGQEKEGPKDGPKEEPK